MVHCVFSRSLYSASQHLIYPMYAEGCWKLILLLLVCSSTNCLEGLVCLVLHHSILVHDAGAIGLSYGYVRLLLLLLP